nr:3-phosphoshikimate 1-carboxyvinyltransferase [Methanolinea mesophila]
MIRKARDVSLAVTAPPSKSFTHRAMICAALAEGPSLLSRPLVSDDTGITERALEQMGARFARDGDAVRVQGTGGRLACTEGGILDMGDSGTSMRLLSSVALLCGCPVVLTGSPRMKERPLGPLMDGLVQLGGSVRYLGQEGFPPVELSGDLKGGVTRIPGEISSQFITSVLIAAPYARNDIEVVLRGTPVSRSYLDITLEVMRVFGGEIRRSGYESFQVKSGTPYRGTDYTIEGDYSSASYFFALAAITGGRVTVHGLNPESCQGDRNFPDILSRMGCTVRWAGTSATVTRDCALKGVEVDMSSSPDTVQTLCMVAACAESPSLITGISHLKYKESDRLAGTERLLSSLGGKIEVVNDSIRIEPSLLRGGTIDPGNDHRTAMSFAVLGLGTGGVTITNAECVNKSYPGFWDVLRSGGLL